MPEELNRQQEDLSSEELEQHEAAELPEHDAMSILGSHGLAPFPIPLPPVDLPEEAMSNIDADILAPQNIETDIVTPRPAPPPFTDAASDELG